MNFIKAINAITIVAGIMALCFGIYHVIAFKNYIDGVTGIAVFFCAISSIQRLKG